VNEPKATSIADANWFRNRHRKVFLRLGFSLVKGIFKKKGKSACKAGCFLDKVLAKSIVAPLN
jgi:hypothetical protein